MPLLASSSSISRGNSPTPALHPLHLPPSPLIDGFPSSLDQQPPPSPSPVGVRSRKNPSTTASTSTTRSTPDDHITRPSLKRITSSNATISPALLDDHHDHSRRSLEELSRTHQQGPAEREIILHELAKTDTIASISLQYGITPQALRSSNRLWPSDSIHLRKTLNVPLDQCHLPSATSGFERIIRDEDGNIIVWQRERVASSSSAAAAASASPNEGILSPKARRLASASAFELGGQEASGSGVDLIGLWGEGSSASASASARGSFDLPDEPGVGGHGRYATANGWHDLKGKGKGRLVDALPPTTTTTMTAGMDDAVANYLSTTHNPYSGSSSPALPPTVPPPPLLSLSPAPTPAEPPDPPPELCKRTLTISRVPSSSLSFFPPSTSSQASSARSSYSEEGRRGVSEGGAAGAKGGSFFGPLANSLARLNLSGGGGRGPGGLGGSWSTSNSSSSSSLNLDAGVGGGAGAGGGGGGGGGVGKVPWSKRWDLSYFGGEEREAERMVGGGGGGGFGMGGMGMDRVGGGDWGKGSRSYREGKKDGREGGYKD